MKFYMPVPFKEFDDAQSSRTKEDCEGRYQAIKKDFGNVIGKTLIDLCCATGYFGFRFFQDGGRSVVGVENDKDVCAFVNDLAGEKGFDFVCKEKINQTDKADIGIYLDTHFHEGTEGYIEFMQKAVKVLYTSSSRDNDDYRILLNTLFEKVEKIYDEGYADRVMFRCERAK